MTFPVERLADGYILPSTMFLVSYSITLRRHLLHREGGGFTKLPQNVCAVRPLDLDHSLSKGEDTS
jgi:hypothetical protein